MLYTYKQKKNRVWKEAAIEDVKAKRNAVIDEKKTEIDDGSNVKVEERTCFFFLRVSINMK